MPEPLLGANARSLYSELLLGAYTREGNLGKQTRRTRSSDCISTEAGHNRRLQQYKLLLS